MKYIKRISMRIQKRKALGYYPVLKGPGVIRADFGPMLEINYAKISSATLVKRIIYLFVY